MAVFNVIIEVNDDVSLEKMEEIIDSALNDNGIDCTYDVTEMITG